MNHKSSKELVKEDKPMDGAKRERSSLRNCFKKYLT